MKLSRKAIMSILAAVILLTSGVVAWTQFFQPNEFVIFETSMGMIEIELNRQKAPISVANFEQYVKDGFYDGTIIHRVTSSGITVVQGGGFAADGSMKTATHSAIKLESNNGLSNIAGTIAMARTSAADSATSQFYFNVVDNTQLDYTSATNPGYAVFGRVVSGMNVVTTMSKVPVGIHNVTIPNYGVYPFEDWPTQDIIITRAYIKP
jgi:cyclophilin family peptidyl-prolyl cis-trans isomerase